MPGDTPSWSPDAPIGMGTRRFSFTVDDLKRLDDLMRINHGRLSAVVGVAVSEKMFHWMETLEDAEELVWLIENREQLMKASNPHP